MKGSIIIVSFFVLGAVLGWAGWLPDFLLETDHTRYALYLLMFLVGASIGADNKLREIFQRLRFDVLLVPLATIVGTLVGSALISVALSMCRLPIVWLWGLASVTIRFHPFLLHNIKVRRWEPLPLQPISSAKF